MQELGDKFENNGFVFTNVFGRPCDHSNFTGRFFKGLLVAAGIETSFRFHDLRHLAVTNFFAIGLNTASLIKLGGDE